MRKREEKRIRQSPKLPAGERRDQILRAAHELFLERGYRATSMDEVAKAVGVTKGGVYFHFSSKSEILLAFLTEIIDGHMRAMEVLAGKHLSPAGMLQELYRIDQEMPLPEARRNLALLSEVIQVPQFLAMINAAYSRSVEAMARSLDPAYGRTLGERRRLVELIHALYDGINFAGMIHPQLGDFKRQTETFAKLTSKTSKRRKKEHDPGNQK